jgi:multisubunit Na+/H+ antiporter MnhG subunit
MAVNDNIKQNRKFGYTVAIALLVLAAFRIFIRHQNMWWILAAIAVILLLLALVKPLWLNPLRLVWDKIGHMLGIINTHILLTLFYFVILTPLSLIMRSFGKDILKLKRNKNNTYWESTPPKTSGMENQF